MTVTKPDMPKRLVQLIVDKLAVDPIGLTNATSFADGLGVDSLDLYELFMSVEKEFEIRIPDEEMEKLKTVGALIDYLNSHLAPVKK